MKKIIWLLIIPVMMMGIHAMPAYAEGDVSPTKAGLKSLLIPGWGQYENGEFNVKKGRIKVGMMAVIEVAAIVTTAVVGGVAGYPQIWIGIGLFIFNHTWSALDAFIQAGESPQVNLGTESSRDKVAMVR